MFMLGYNVTDQIGLKQKILLLIHIILERKAYLHC